MALTPSFGSETKQCWRLRGATSVRIRSRHRQLIDMSIASVVLLGAMVAIPCCFLCIARRLEAITSVCDPEQRQDKKYETPFETATCFLVPALYMGLRALHRYLVARLRKLIQPQTQLFRIVALLYLRISAAKQQSVIISPPWLSFGFRPSVSP
jgi:hypothetical protein